jgi:NDP-sugar pyrophosphorylase family protein
MTNLGNGPVRVVVLAGGTGTRLRPLTAVFPKPLMPLGDKPVVELLLRQLASHKLRHITLSTGYLAPLMKAVVGDGSQYGVEVSYSHEEQPLGTAGPLTLVRDALTEPFMVMNGDLLTTLSFTKMLAHHQHQQADVTLGLYRRDVAIDFGVIETDELGEYVGYREKPTYHYDVSMGVYAMSRSVLEHVPHGTRLDMPDLVRSIHRAGGRVACYRENCFWLDIGRMDDYSLAQEQYAAHAEMFVGSQGGKA